MDYIKLNCRHSNRYVDSNAMLHLGTLVSNDPMFYVLQGNNYCEMMLFDEAEKPIKKLFLSCLID